MLVVDDDPAVRAAAKDSLQGAGYAVVTAGNGQEALAALHNGTRPALVLFDLEMPGMDGWQFRAEMTAVPGLAEVPVVVMSQARAVELAAHCLFAVGFVKKPLQGGELLEAVRRHAGRRP